MEPHTLIDDISRKISDLAAKTPLADMEKNARALLTNLLARADLVTREEFDRQTERLTQTRQRLVELESKISQLEDRSKVDPALSQQKTGSIT